MNNFLEKLRIWALIKLADGRPVALNLKLHNTLHLHESTERGVFVNVRVDSDCAHAFFFGPKSND